MSSTHCVHTFAHNHDVAGGVYCRAMGPSPRRVLILRRSIKGVSIDGRPGVAAVGAHAGYPGDIAGRLALHSSCGDELLAHNIDISLVITAHPMGRRIGDRTIDGRPCARVADDTLSHQPWSRIKILADNKNSDPRDNRSATGRRCVRHGVCESPALPSVPALAHDPTQDGLGIGFFSGPDGDQDMIRAHHIDVARTVSCKACRPSPLPGTRLVLING